VVVDGADRDLVLGLGAVLVDADDDLLAPGRSSPDGGRRTPRCGAWASPRRPPWSCRRWTPPPPSAPRRRRRAPVSALDVVGAAEGIDDLRDPRLLLEDQLRVPRDPRRRSRRATPSPRRSCWCGGTGCRPRPPPAPRRRCGPRCSWGPALGARRRRSGSGCGA
jgi:hypothetical protein